jgi:hypothetical protein
MQRTYQYLQQEARQAKHLVEMEPRFKVPEYVPNRVDGLSSPVIVSSQEVPPVAENRKKLWRRSGCEERGNRSEERRDNNLGGKLQVREDTE